jgi:hypothetical protein
MVVEYHSLKWPTWLKAPPALGLGTEGTEADGSDPSHSVTSVSSVASVSSVLIGTPLSSSVPGGAAFQIQSIDDVLRRCMPDRVHENNHLLFILARGIKSLEQSRSSSFSQDEKREFFEQWHTQAGPFLRPGQSKDDYWIEFLNAVRRAKFPLGGQALANAWAAAQLNQPPPEALQFDKPELRLLVSFCWELQAINGGNQFYLSARVCAELFGHPSHTLAYKWLCALCQLGILVVVERGNSHKATRYRYISAG